MDLKCIKMDNVLFGVKNDGNFHVESGTHNSFEPTFSVDDAVNKAGYGKFQIRLTCLAGLGWFADAAEIFILSVIGNYLSCDWKLYRWQLAMLTSLVFGGIMIGCPVIGSLADIYGRKKALSVSLTMMFIFGAVSAASPSYVWLVVLRTLMGFALGGISQGLTLCSEYCPTKMRGRAGFYLCYFWSFGTFGVILLAWVVMEYLNNWRVLLAVTAVPALLVVVSLKWYPESPRYYLVSNQHKKATKLLQKMADVNKSDLPPGQLEDFNENAVRGRLRDLFTQEYRKTTILFWYIWFASAFTYYGIALLTPIIIQRGGLITSDEITNSNSSDGIDFMKMDTVVPCTEFSQKDYIDLLWTSSAEFPGLLAFTFLVECCRRKILLGGACIISSALIFLLLLKTHKIVILIFLFGARGILLATFQLILIMTSEVFPTTVRALAMGTGSGYSRLGGLIVPYVAQVLVIENPIAAVCVLAGVTLLCVFAAAFIPETKGERLKDSTRITQKEKAKLDTGS